MVYASTRRRVRRAMALALCTSLCLGDAIASAQSDPDPAGEGGVAFDEADPKQAAEATKSYVAGLELLEQQKDPESALAKFRESYAVVASANTHMMIVRSLIEARRWPEAHDEAVIALEEAKLAAAKSDKYKKAVEGLTADLATARQEVAMLTVRVAGAPDDATVTLAGREIAKSRWGSAIAVMPGTVEVLLSSSAGNQTKSATAVAGQSVEVTFGPPPPKVAAAQPPPAPVEDGGGYAGPDRRILGVAAGAVGVLGFVGLGVFSALAKGQLDRLESGCDPDTPDPNDPAAVARARKYPDAEHCDPALEDEADKGRTYQAVSYAGLAIGIAGIGAGAGLFLWHVYDSGAGGPEDGGNEGADDASLPRVRIGAGPATLVVRGEF